MNIVLTNLYESPNFLLYLDGEGLTLLGGKLSIYNHDRELYTPHFHYFINYLQKDCSEFEVSFKNLKILNVKSGIGTADDYVNWNNIRQYKRDLIDWLNRKPKNKRLKALKLANNYFGLCYSWNKHVDKYNLNAKKLSQNEWEQCLIKINNSLLENIEDEETTIPESIPQPKKIKDKKKSGYKNR
jgi:hypothetical protein